MKDESVGMPRLDSSFILQDEETRRISAVSNIIVQRLLSDKDTGDGYGHFIEFAHPPLQWAFALVPHLSWEEWVDNKSDQMAVAASEG